MQVKDVAYGLKLAPRLGRDGRHRGDPRVDRARPRQAPPRRVGRGDGGRAPVAEAPLRSPVDLFTHVLVAYLDHLRPRRVPAAVSRGRRARRRASPTPTRCSSRSPAGSRSCATTGSPTRSSESASSRSSERWSRRISPPGTPRLPPRHGGRRGSPTSSRTGSRTSPSRRSMPFSGRELQLDADRAMNFVTLVVSVVSFYLLLGHRAEPRRVRPVPRTRSTLIAAFFAAYFACVCRSRGDSAGG